MKVVERDVPVCRRGWHGKFGQRLALWTSCKYGSVPNVVVGALDGGYGIWLGSCPRHINEGTASNTYESLLWRWSSRPPNILFYWVFPLWKERVDIKVRVGVRV